MQENIHTKTEFEKEFPNTELDNRISKDEAPEGFSPLHYFVVFLVTVALFVAAFGLSSFLGNKKLEKVKYIQDDISIDILSSETQFALLQNVSCKDVSSSMLSTELNNLASKIEYSEQNIKSPDEVVRLKKYYSLLQVKDYLLMKKAAERCGLKSIFVLYFYTTEEYCRECTRQGYVLTELRKRYPDLRVYSFDYGLDLGIIKTLIRTYKLSDKKLPALIVGDEVMTGFHAVEDIEAFFPEQFKKDQAEKTNNEASAPEEVLNSISKKPVQDLKKNESPEKK